MQVEVRQQPLPSIVVKTDARMILASDDMGEPQFILTSSHLEAAPVRDIGRKVTGIHKFFLIRKLYQAPLAVKSVLAQTVDGGMSFPRSTTSMGSE